MKKVHKQNIVGIFFLCDLNEEKNCLFFKGRKNCRYKSKGYLEYCCSAAAQANKMATSLKAMGITKI
jgi:hypothetical protein